MIKPVLLFGAVVCLVVLGMACGVKPIAVKPSEDASRLDSLMDEWRSQAAKDYGEVDFQRAMEIANTMALKGPEGLEPFFKIIEAPDATPVAKILAVASLGPHINDSHAPRLLPLTEAEHDRVTRGCAVNLLNNTISADAFFRINELMHDEDSHVSKVAVLAMLRKGVPEALEKSLQLWDNPETPVRDRDEIILGMPDSMVINNLRIFQEALQKKGLSPQARLRAIKILEQVGTTEALPDLEACLEDETDSNLRDMITVAINAIKKRDEEGIVAVPVQALPDMDIVFEPHAPAASAENSSPAPDAASAPEVNDAAGQ